MGFAVELDVDETNAAPIKALSDAIYAQCGGENLTGIGGHPHLSLTVFTQVEPAAIDTLLAEFAATTAPLSITFTAVGVFPTGEGVVYLAPVVTAPLLALHAHFHERLSQLALASNAYYRPSHWMPHCTVGLALPPDKIGQAVTLCRQAALFRTVTLTTVRLIEFRPVRPIFSYPLQGV